ncbi:MAG: hypothetical protein ABIW34_07545, partial [Ginsengibacter sp.]
VINANIVIVIKSHKLFGENSELLTTSKKIFTLSISKKNLLYPFPKRKNIIAIRFRQKLRMMDFTIFFFNKRLYTKTSKIIISNSTTKKLISVSWYKTVINE